MARARRRLMPAPGSSGRPAEVRVQDPPPTFSAAFYAITITINASPDGVSGGESPASIEEVCDIPKGLAAEAAELIGGEGVAIISSATKVFNAAGRRLTGAAATTALAGADSVSLKGQRAARRCDVPNQPSGHHRLTVLKERRLIAATATAPAIV